MIDHFEQPLHSAHPPVIHLIGDCTMADQCTRNDNPGRGWGQLLRGFFQPEAPVLNHARDGRSSRSFVWEGHWQNVLASVHPGDWLVIQFGHNDQKIERPLVGTDPVGSYTDFLTRFVRDADRRGVNPVFATSIHRRRFEANGELVDTLGDYPPAMRRLAVDFDVPLIDLHEQTGLLLQSLGPEASKELFRHIAPGKLDQCPAGRTDDTRLSTAGARLVAGLFAESLRDYPLPLARWLRPKRTLPAAHRAMSCAGRQS
ncbi:MAG: rhamnogalacturonan acetylesterase [Verrucomicrobiota bacterium]